jgi:hypothetical protein
MKTQPEMAHSHTEKNRNDMDVFEKEIYFSPWNTDTFIDIKSEKAGVLRPEKVYYYSDG